jgi:hypothetical protein
VRSITLGNVPDTGKEGFVYWPNFAGMRMITSNGGKSSTSEVVGAFCFIGTPFVTIVIAEAPED